METSLHKKYNTMMAASDVDKWTDMLKAIDALDSESLSGIWFHHMIAAESSFERPERCALFAEAMRLTRIKLQDRGYKISYNVAEVICSAFADQIPGYTFELDPE